MQPVGQLSMTVQGGGKVAIVGDEAWLVHGVAGVQRISLADPEQPRVLGHWLPAVATSLRASRRVTAAARIGAGRAALLVDDLPSGERPFRAVLMIAEVAAGRPPRVLDELELPCCGLHLKVQAGHSFVAQQESWWIRGFEIDAAGRIEQASSWQLPERVLGLVVGEAALWARSDAHYFVIDTAVTGAMRGPFELGASFSPLAAVGGQLLSVSQGLGQDQGVEWMDRAGAREAGPRLELATYVEIEPSPDGLWTMDGAVHHVSRLVPGDGPTSWRQVSTDLLADGIRAEQRMSAEGRLLAVADWWDIQVAQAE
jgi:hypothetical protein